MSGLWLHIRMFIKSAYWTRCRACHLPDREVFWERTPTRYYFHPQWAVTLWKDIFQISKVPWLLAVLVTDSFAVKRHHDQGSSYKPFKWGLAYSFRGLAHYDRKHSSMQSGALSSWSYILICSQRERETLGLTKSTPTPWDTSSNNATPPNPFK